METPLDENNQLQDEDLLNVNDVIDTSVYDKKVKDAQNAIFIVAGVQLVFGVILAFAGNEELRNFQIIFSVIVSAIFFGLAFWSKRMPFTALIIALSLYLLIQILNAINDYSTIYKGIIIKAFIIFYLIKGIGAAKAAQDLKKLVK